MSVGKVSYEWARAPEFEPIRSNVKIMGLRNELEPSVIERENAELRRRAWSETLSVKMRISNRRAWSGTASLTQRLLTERICVAGWAGHGRKSDEIEWQCFRNLIEQMMVFETATSAKKCKMVMLRNGFLGTHFLKHYMLRGNWKWGSLARHIPNMHTHGSNPPPPPPAHGLLMRFVSWY